MSTLRDILAHNARFVANRGYEPFRSDARPNKKLVIVTCMDTRLLELLPRAMNIHHGDVMMIKVAGAIVAHPYGSVMRSILVSVHKLGAQEIAVIGHHDCGMVDLNSEDMLRRISASGVSPDALRKVKNSGVDLGQWLTGFRRVEDSVRASVEIIRDHPLLPDSLRVYGMVIDPTTGRLDLVDQPLGIW
jgi:carbonic anhydrase